MPDGSFHPRPAIGAAGAAGAADTPIRALPSIRWLAWRVFAPLDLGVNAVINGAIAWWLYGGRTEVSLTGPGGLTMMALPMSFILATVTTFCGFWNAVRERQAARATPPLAADARWVLRAVGESLATGAVTWLVAQSLAAGLSWVAPKTAVGPIGAIVVITALAAALGFLLHGRAVMRGGAV